MAKQTKKSQTKKSTSEVAERAPETRGGPFGQIGLDEWFERWPEMFARRWPESLRGLPMLEDSFRLEEFTDEDGSFVLRAELPGIDPDEDLDITVENGRLRIDARREERSEDRENGNYRSEFRYGSFHRSIRLPEGAVEDDITAGFKAGILEVRVPRSEEAPPAKSIEVSNDD